jgi:DNA polymerase-3 subunit alpha
MINWDEIESIEEVGVGEVYDLRVFETDVYKDSNFVAGGVVTHNSGFHTSWVRRKKGVEKYERHPVLEPVMAPTHYCLIYQETISKLLEVIGLFPPNQCEEIRKAISKKKEGVFEKYKPQFITNGQKTLGWNEDKVEEFWSQIEKFAQYAFNLSHAVSYTVISMRLLLLKAHFPLEFFTAILSCESKEDKIKEYRNDAKDNFGIDILPIDLNRSKVNFEIFDEVAG